VKPDPRTFELHAVHRLIQALGHDAAVQQRFGSDRAGLFAEFGITPEDAAALQEGSIAALASIGVHPILRMHWLMMSQPGLVEQMSVAEYLPVFEAGAADG
jgi:2'-aminobiphenyl-2,3-diol 1,2-dioxygenase, small subunit